MKRLAKLTIGTTLLAMSASQAMAADSADVKVAGTIVPPACVPVIAGGAVFDYGGIKAASLAMNDYTVLNEMSRDFSITCESPVKIAIKSTDARKDSAVVPVGKKINSVVVVANDVFSGLGQEDGKNIGGYRMNLNPFSIVLDGNTSVKLDPIRSSDGKAWSKSSSFWLSDDGMLSSFAVTGSLLPKEFTTLKAKIYVQAAINKGSELTLTKVNYLNGMTNLQIVYL